MPRLSASDPKVRLLARYLYEHCVDRARLEVHGELFPQGTLKKKALRDCFQWVEQIVEEQNSCEETWAPDRFFTRAACAQAIKVVVHQYGLQSSIALNRKTFKTWVDEQAKRMQVLCIRARRNTHARWRGDDCSERSSSTPQETDAATSPSCPGSSEARRD